MPSSSMNINPDDKQQAISDITEAVKKVSLEIAKKELKEKRVIYGIQYREVQSNKTLAPNRWNPGFQSINKEERDNAWEVHRRDADVSRNENLLVDAIKKMEYRKTIQVDNVLIAEVYDNTNSIEEIWAMILVQGLVKSDQLKIALEEIIKNSKKADNEKEMDLPID